MPPSSRPIGQSGVSSPSGWLRTRDRNSDLRFPLGTGTTETVGEYQHAAATEPALASCLAAMVLPIARGEWTIAADEDEVDEEIVDFVREEILENLKPDFRDVVRETARAMLSAGFHVCEPLYRKRPDGMIGIKALAPRPAWTFRRILFDEDGVLEALEQQTTTPEGRYVVALLPAASVLVFTHEREGNDPTGRSMVRPIWRACRVKDHLQRLIAIRNEREALGLPIGHYPVGATKDDIDRLEDALAQYRAHERSYMVLPEGFTVDLPEGKAGASDALRLDSAHLTVEIQSAFLQAWQSLGQSGSSSGGRAVGETQANPYYMALESIGGEIAAPFDDLIRRLVDLNFGPQEYYPYLCPPKIRPDDVLAGLTPILESIKAGGLTPDVDVENNIRERLGIEERAEAAPVQADPVSASPSSTDKAETKTVEKNEAPDAPADMKATDAGKVSLAWYPRRTLSPAEQRVAFGEMAARFDAAPADLQALVANAIRRQQRLIGKWIRPMARRIAAGDRAGFDALAKADLPKASRKAIVDAVLSYAADMSSFGRAQAEREKRLSPAASRKAATAAQAAVREDAAIDAPATFADPPPPEDLDPATAAEASILGDRIADEMLRVIRLAATRAAANGVRLAPGTIPLVDVIEEAVAGAVETAATGMSSTRDAAIAVAVRAVSGGRREVFEEDKADIVRVSYSAAMDDNTCGACAEWDEKDAPTLEAADATLPGTPNGDCEGTAARCRCIWVIDWA